MRTHNLVLRVGCMSNTTTPTFTTGDRLRKAREFAGVSVHDMAEALGVTRNTVTNYEHERTAIPVNALVAYGRTTGVSVAWLIEGDDLDLRSRCFSLDMAAPHDDQQLRFLLAA